MDEVRILFRAKAVKNDDPEAPWMVEGYAATSGLKSDGLDIPPEVLAEAVREDGAEWPIVTDHNDDANPRKVVGKTVAKTADNLGIYVRGLISRAEGDLWIKLQEGLTNFFSIRANTRTKPGPNGTAIATGLQVRHLMITPFPVDPLASFQVARADGNAAVVSDVDAPRSGSGGEELVAEGQLLGIAAVTGAAWLTIAAAAAGGSK